MLDHRGKMYEAFSFFLFIYLLLQGILSRQKCDDSLFTLSSFVYFSCVKFDLIKGGPFTDMHHLV